MLELTGVTLPGPAQQRVTISANGTNLGEIAVTPGETERFSLAIPAAALGDSGFVDISLDYPDAIMPGKRVANTYWRSVKLTAAATEVTPSAQRTGCVINGSLATRGTILGGANERSLRLSA
jgi:hypothetical protein